MANVTINMTMEGSAEFTVDKYSLTFTTSNYSTAQTVTLSAAEDDRHDYNVLKIIHTASGGGFQGVIASMTATVDDNDNDNDGTLVVSDPTTTTVLLTMSGYSGNWWYQRAGWSECQGPVTTYTYRVTGLQPNASSYINASCNIVVSAAITFGTLQTPVSVSNLNTTGNVSPMYFGHLASYGGRYFRLATAFRTGPHGNGYQLSSVTARVQVVNDAGSHPVRAKLYLEMTNSGVETNSPSNAGWTIGNEISVMQTGYPWVRVQRDQDDLKHLGAIAAYMLVGVAGIVYKLLNTGTPREQERSTW